MLFIGRNPYYFEMVSYDWLDSYWYKSVPIRIKLSQRVGKLVIGRNPFLLF